MHSLIFFVLGFAACRQGTGSKKVALIFEKGKAVGISIPTGQLPGLGSGPVSSAIHVRLAGNGYETGMLGDFSEGAGSIIFRPLIPLSPGERYTISYRGKQISSITVPRPNQDAPALLAIFPQADTLPENLLKIYLQFSEPMREGQSQKYVALLNMEHDTVPAVFLDLQPELWNRDRTVLTLWLDPGRIKRGLQPNERLGNPLKKGQRYIISVSGEWAGARGARLARAYTREFVAGKRDGASPSVSDWDIKIPERGTAGALHVGLGQALDHFLLTEALQVQDAEGKKISGKFRPADTDRAVSFFPDKPWQKGKYILFAEPRLEDLAGNNLDRPFDTDTKAVKEPVVKHVYIRDFVID